MNDPNFHITTPRLHISYFQPFDDKYCDFIVELYNTPKFITAIGGKPTSITTREKARSMLSTRFIQEFERNGYGTYLISLRNLALYSPGEEGQIGGDGTQVHEFKDIVAKEEFIGTVSLLRGKDSPYLAPDIGFAVLPAYMRKGVATEAGIALIRYAQEKLGVRAVFGFCDGGNQASMATLRKLGMKDEGTRKLTEFGGAESRVWSLGMQGGVEEWGVE